MFRLRSAPPQFIVAFLVGVIGCQIARGQQEQDAGGDELAIRAAVASYVAAFNQGDATAVANHWSDGGTWISPSGERFRGRSAIEAEMKAYFAETQGQQRIEVLNPSIRLLASNVAVEEGVARVTRSGEPPSDTSYIALHVKSEGTWKLDTVRETTLEPAPSDHEHLQELEWMVGTWVDSDEEGSIETTCDWTKNGHFLTRSFTVRIQDRIEMEGTQVIGWDPDRQQIRSWLFDSEGGFGEGFWTRDGDRWIVKSSQVLKGGEKASSINVMTYVDDNTLIWQSTGRELDGHLLPNVDPVTVTRK